MRREPSLQWSHVFVDKIPSIIEPNILYISIPYRTSKHLCPCGCGLEIVTPIRPNKWSVEFNGVSVSLYPSVGNWSLDCRSHYWFTNNRIVWAEEWSNAEIEEGRKRQSILDKKYFDSFSEEKERIQPRVPSSVLTPWISRLTHVLQMIFRSPKVRK